MFITLWLMYMFVTLWHYYVCDEMDMFNTMAWHDYLHQIVTRLGSSHCNVCICSSHFNVTTLDVSWYPLMFVPLRRQGYVHYIAMCVYVCHIVTLLCLQWHIYVHHIAMKGICSSNYDNKAMFITLQHQDIFITFWRYYVCHITTSFFSSHCDERDMSITLQHLYMFVTLWNYYVYNVRVMFVTLRW